jgi:hypothetical protein
VSTGQPRQAPAAPAEPEPIDTATVTAAAPDDATVTPIDAAQRKRTDGPRPA